MKVRKVDKGVCVLEKKYLSAEQFRQLLQSRMEEYSSRPELEKMIEPVRKGFINLSEEIDRGHLKVYQVSSGQKVHTFIEIQGSSLRPESVEHLKKVSNFILQVDGHCGYLPLS